MLAENRQFERTAPLFGAPVGVTSLEFCQDFWHQKLESLGYRIALFA